MSSLHSQISPIPNVPNGCGQWWRKPHSVGLEHTQLTSVDGITKHTPHLRGMSVYGRKPFVVSNETFKTTPHLRGVVMRNLNQFPMSYSSKATLLHVDLGGRAISCIEEAELDGMTAVRHFRLYRTSLTQFPQPGCSKKPYENDTVQGYFQSLIDLTIYSSNLERLPSLHNASQLVRIILLYNKITTTDDLVLPEPNSLYQWRIWRDTLTTLPNLPSLGTNSSPTILQLTENKICFPSGFEMFNLLYIYFQYNRIDYICNMNFAPNIKAINLTKIPLFDIDFLESTNVPLLSMHNVLMRFNGIDLISDSAFRVIPHCRVLHLDNNKIKLFPNIKLIANSAVLIRHDKNLIEDVPCTALDKMKELLTLHLEDNMIKLVCPDLISMAPKLYNLGLSGNRLVGIADLRMPSRSQPTTVVLTHWGRDKMAAISQTTFSNVFSSMKTFEFRLKFHWSLFPRSQLTIFQHWFR